MAVDGNSVTLGRVLSASRESLTVITSTGHTVTLGWNGAIPIGQIWYSGAGCTGTAYLNSGGATPRVSHARWVVYSRAFNTLMRPALVAGGVSTSTGGFPVQSIDNPDCGTATTGNGWQLEAITNATAGLPATIAGPITIP
jgi:hypothetical protein